MSEHERLVYQVGHLLSQVARPHRCDDGLPDEVKVGLSQLGLACTEQTSRQELIVRLWALKRGALTVMPPSAA
jgi:hypothetical protein